MTGFWSSWAHVETADIDGVPFIAAAAGAAPEASLYADGVLYVDGVTQAALDAALAAHDPTTAAKARLVDYAADKRWRVETGGLTVGGTRVDTSRESQSMIANAHAYVAASGATSISYKADSGWVTMDAATVTAVALAIGAHVQAAFAAEEAADAAIAAGTITSTAEIDAAAWPV